MKKPIVFVISAALIVSSLVTAGTPAAAESIQDLREQISENEQEKSRLSEERNTLDSDRQNTESKISENIGEQETVGQEILNIEEELVETQTEITEKETEIETTNKEIDQLTEQIEELQEEIEILEDKIEKRDVLLKDRLRAIQQNGGQIRYIEVIFGAQSFGDLISRATAVNTIMEQDQQIMEEQAADKQLLAENKQEVEENKATVVAKKEDLENQKQELLVLQDQLDEQIEERQVLLAELEIEHGELEEVKLTIEEEQAILSAEEKAKAQAIAMAENRIGELEQLAREEERKRKEEEQRRVEQERQKELERQREQEKQREQATASSGSSSQGSKQVAPAPEQKTSGSNSSGGSGGIFINPSGGTLSSGFGMRNHPVYKEQRLHAGVDYSVPTGTPLRAPADGVVSTARSMGGFGNVIMISHYINGQSYTTVSAHLSRIDVSPGQQVKQGQVIGATGNTGTSTGPHLHFEVHIGGYGNPVNPMPYLR